MTRDAIADKRRELVNKVEVKMDFIYDFSCADSIKMERMGRASERLRQAWNILAGIDSWRTPAPGTWIDEHPAKNLKNRLIEMGHGFTIDELKLINGC